VPVAFGHVGSVNEPDISSPPSCGASRPACGDDTASHDADARQHRRALLKLADFAKCVQILS